jgi:anthranilate phosphoribosyltransferase
MNTTDFCNSPATVSMAGKFERLFAPETSEAELASILLGMQDGLFDGADLTSLLLMLKNERQASLAAGSLDFLLEFGRQSIDCAGSGGSGLPHFNTSTAVAFTLSAGGISVSKFGNKAASGRSGSFDLLEYLGFPCFVRLEALSEVVPHTNLALLNARQFYPDLSRLASVRRSLGKPTVFNYLGPLLNPAEPAFRLMGVAQEAFIPAVADYLSSESKVKQAMIVRSAGGLDEIEASGLSRLVRIAGQQVSESAVDADGLLAALAGSQPLSISASAGAFSEQLLDVRSCAGILTGITSGDDTGSRYYRQVLLNSAAAFVVGGYCACLLDGCRLAQDLLASGAVAIQIDKCRRHYERISC